MTDLVTSDGLLSGGFIPIRHITFVLSAFIAFCSELRIKFYNYFDRYIPVITQCIFNHIRSGPICDEYYIVDPKLDKEKYYSLNPANLSETFYDREFFLTNRGFELLVLWFNILNEHSLSEDPNYLEFAELEKIPILSMKLFIYPG